MISVLILTKNEEQDLPGCLESIKWSDDIHVFDSYSDDRTVDIAENYGAVVTKRHFDNWSAHQNWGLENIPFKHPWVFYIDADERMTPELAENVQKIVQNEKHYVAFRFERRDFLMDKWLKHVQPQKYSLRLFRPEKMRYERLVNPVSIVDGPIGFVEGYHDHFPFSKGFSHWFTKHNSYSSFEASQIISNREKQESFSIQKAFFEKDFHKRRFHQKELFYRMPARPFIKFIYLYLFKKGFLDGKAGFTYALLQSIYEYMIVLKVKEMESASPGSQR